MIDARGFPASSEPRGLTMTRTHQPHPRMKAMAPHTEPWILVLPSHPSRSLFSRHGTRTRVVLQADVELDTNLPTRLCCYKYVKQHTIRNYLSQLSQSGSLSLSSMCCGVSRLLSKDLDGSERNSLAGPLTRRPQWRKNSVRKIAYNHFPIT